MNRFSIFLLIFAIVAPSTFFGELLGSCPATHVYWPVLTPLKGHESAQVMLRIVDREARKKMMHSCGMKMFTSRYSWNSVPVDSSSWLTNWPRESPMVVMLEVRIQKSYITEYLEVGTQKSPAWNAQTKTEFLQFL